LKSTSEIKSFGTFLSNLIIERANNFVQFLRSIEFIRLKLNGKYTKPNILNPHPKSQISPDSYRDSNLKWFLTAFKVFNNNPTLVIGPTPPGTGVIQLAFSDTSSNFTSPFNR
jgi:hypothetical protein